MIGPMLGLGGYITPKGLVPPTQSVHHKASHQTHKNVNYKRSDWLKSSLIWVSVISFSFLLRILPSVPQPPHSISTPVLCNLWNTCLENCLAWKGYVQTDTQRPPRSHLSFHIYQIRISGDMALESVCSTHMKIILMHNPVWRVAHG